MSIEVGDTTNSSTRPSRWVELRAGVVEYRLALPSSDADGGPHLVLLHEGLGSLSAWRDWPERLAAATRRPVMAYSRYGYGRSAPTPLPRSERYMHEEALEVLPELLTALRIEAPILVGHSDGASIALICAGSGHGVAGVVAIAPHVFIEEWTLAGIRAARDSYRYGDLRDRLARHHDDVDAAFAGWNDTWLHPAFATWSIEEYLPRVTAPVLAVQCTDDPYGTIDQLDRIERAVRGPFSRLVLDSGGHAPHRSHPDEVVAAISQLCTSST